MTRAIFPRSIHAFKCDKNRSEILGDIICPSEITCRILINQNLIIKTAIPIRALKILGIWWEFDSDKIILRFDPSQEIAY